MRIKFNLIPTTEYSDSPSHIHHRWIALFILTLASIFILFASLQNANYANSYISAAVQAGAQNWHSFFFGSVDFAGSTSLDFSPVGLWPSMLSVRFFGLASWAIMVPQALIGLVCVFMIYYVVYHALPSKYCPDVVALIAAWSFLLTPMASLVFHYNYPQPLMILLTIALVSFAVRAFRYDSWLDYVWAGMCFGTSFIIGQVQSFLILPGLIIAWILCARKKIYGLFFLLASLMSGLWYPVIVSLWPSALRPWIGGTNDNSIWSQIFITNGLNRITRSYAECCSMSNFTLPFSHFLGGQISWLLPIALIMGVASLFIHRKEKTRTFVYTWVWALLSVVFMSSILGSPFSYLGLSILAPLIAVTSAIGLISGLIGEKKWRLITALSLAINTYWAFELFDRSSTTFQGLRYIVLVLGFMAVLLVVGLDIAPGFLIHKVWLPALFLSAGAAFYLGPASYTYYALNNVQSGIAPVAGPRILASTVTKNYDSSGHKMGPTTQVIRRDEDGTLRVEVIHDARVGAAGRNSDSVPSQMVTRFLSSQGSLEYSWVAAASGGSYTANLQLETGYSILPIGGQNGDTTNITLEQFQEAVFDKKIHFYLITQNPSNEYAKDFDQWIEDNFMGITFEGVKIYDLTGNEESLQTLRRGYVGAAPSRRPEPPGNNAPQEALPSDSVVENPTVEDPTVEGGGDSPEL